MSGATSGDGAADSPDGSAVARALERDGFLVVPVTGRSMWPMLRGRRDTVTLLPPHRTPELGDVALYRAGGRHVLHRLVGRWPDGAWRVRGDDTLVDEHVPESAILGVVAEFHRGGRRVVCGESAWYRRYWRLWLALWPVRRVAMTAWRRSRHAAGTLLRRLGWRGPRAHGR